MQNVKSILLPVPQSIALHPQPKVNITQNLILITYVILYMIYIYASIFYSDFSVKLYP